MEVQEALPTEPAADDAGEASAMFKTQEQFSVPKGPRNELKEAQNDLI